MPSGSLYEAMGEAGIGYGPRFRVVGSVWSGEGEALVEVSSGEGSGDGWSSVMVLDGCFQALAAATGGGGSEGTWLPFGWERLWLSGPLPGRLLCHARLLEGGGESASDVRTAELGLYAEDGTGIGGVRGFVLRRATRAALLSAVTGVEGLLYDVVWRERALAGGLRPAEFLVSPGEVADGAEDLAVHLAAEGVEADATAAFLGDIERLARSYALEALEGLGWRREAGAVVRASELRRALKVVAEHERLLDRLFGLLEEGGVLERTRPRVWWCRRRARRRVCARTPGRLRAPGELLDALRERYPFGGVELGLLGRCGAALCDVLRGRVEGLELLFGVEGGGAESLYHEAPLLRAMNRQVGEVVSGLVEAMPEGRRLRVLEVGAGTGGTTGAVLGALPAGGYEYTYTDISAGFFGGAEGRFGGEGASLVYRVLDIERDPVGQGFEAHGYDVVVAANVLHATRDLGEALVHCRALLAPSGVLVCLEGLRSQGWLDLTFGLLEGWWRYGDGYRTDGALVGEGVWRRALGEAGYGEVSVVSSGSGATQGVIVARGPSEVVEPEGLWLLASDRGETGRRLAAGLVERNQRVVVAGEDIAWPTGEAPPGVRVAHVEPQRREAWRSLVEGLVGEGALRGVVHLSGLDGGGEEALTSEEPTSETLTSEGLLGEVAHGSGSALALVQGLLDADVAPTGGVWLVTRGAQSLGRERGGALAGAALWGLGRTVALEAPGLGARLVDLDPGTEADIGALVDELLSPDRETQVAHRGGVRHGARLVRGAASGGLSVPGDGPWRLVPDRGGLLEGLRAEAVSGVALGAGEVRVAVDAAGLNFHDVLIAMQVVDAQSPLGGELSGRVVETGPGVARVSVGERVAGLAGGAFGTHVVTREELLWPVPAGMGASAAATVPVVYVTVALAFELAGVKAGERVLVHAAAGGVGHAAIALARRLGAEVVATASEAKRAHVRSLGVTHVFDSRTTGFARGVLEATGGAGVDVVLNSLTGAGFVEASLECLREGGRFVELGKRDIWSEEAMRGVRPDVGYRVLAVDEWLEDAEGRVRVGAAFGEVMAGLSGGELAALPFDAWPLVEAGGAMRWMGSGRHVGKVVLRAPGVVGGRLRGEGTYLVTGGLGGIGREVAEWLAERGAGAIVLNGRRPPAPEVEAALEALRARGVRVEVEIADVSDGEAVEAMLSRIAKRLPPLAGVIHSVGVLSDAALTNQDWGRFERVLGPKMVGAWHLHRATRDLELDLFVLFTSVAGVLGNAGQANHAAANAFLDRLARHRRALGLAGQAVAWGAWSGTGEAEEQRGRIEERMRAAGQGWLTPVQGLQALDRVVERDAAAAVVTAVEWSVLGGRLTSIPAFLEEVVSSEGAASREAEAAGGDGLVSRLRRVVGAEREAVLVEFVQDELQEVLRLAERPSATVGFFDLGMDSLMAVELRNRLSRALTGVCTVSGTAVFDHPDAQRLGRHLAGELGMLGEAPAPVSAPVRAPVSAAVAVEDARVAIVGMACRFPGGADLGAFWEQLEAGRDAVMSVPRGQARPGGRPVRGGGVHPEPATVREPASAVAQGASGRFANAGRPLRSSPRRRESTRAEAAEELPYKAVADDSAGSRWGAYIEDIDRFDAAFFRIAPVEARLLDPQQRLLLETSWEALEEAGIDPAGLRGSRTGVFAGISSNDYQEYVSPGGGSDVLTLYTATGSSHSAAIGRIAFTLGLEGPAIAVDTACSSSLVALHQAVVSLQRGESDLALAGGVHAILSPMATEIFVKAGMLSPDGRCKTFDAAADGFVRGEGCAMVVLKRLSDAEAAGDRIWAVVRGSAVNQDGASAGLTVPSGPAQERVIGEALSRAGLAPSEVDYLEAHGTGTELGDPVEAHAAAAAYGRGRAADRPLLIGTVKTNVGHLEAAAGVAGLVKTVLAMHHGMIPRHLHYETPSPRMDWTRLPLRVVSEAVPWPVVDRPMRAGVSSFGFSGTNAHVILESHGLPGDEGAGAGAVRPVGAATGAVAGAYSLRGRPVGAAHLVGTWRAEGEGSPEMDAPAPAGARLPAGQATAADTTRSGSRAQSIQSEDSSSTLPAPEARDIEPRVRRLLALSARSDAALRGLATRYLAWLDGQVGQVGEDGPAGEDGQAGPARDDAEQAARDGQAGEDGQAGRHGQTGDSAEPAGQEGQPGPAGHDAGMDALLADMAWTAGVGRSRFEHRAGVVFGGVEELRGGLERLASEGGRGVGGATRVAFLFTGQGSQWAGMGRALYRREPVVRAVLERCEREMVSLRGESLLDVMFGREGAAGSVDDTTWTQPALYALGCALSALWESVGVRPVAVLGHSVGELAAAHVAGVFGLEAGLRLASVRGELMGGLPSDVGAMTAVFASAERVEALIEESGAEGVEVAADNGTHRVVSGVVEGVEALEGWCSDAGVRCGRLVTSHAFHSALMEPVLDGIEAAAGDIEVRSPVVSLVSNVTGRVVGEGELLDGAYWRRHARAPVAYGSGVGALSGLGVDVVIELGPGAVLGPLLAQVWPGDDVPVVLASQRRALASGHRDAASGYRDAESADDPGAIVSGGMRAAVSSGEEDGFIEAVAGAWEAGLGLKFEGLHAGEARRRLSLPTYPFERRRYWVEGSGRRHAVGGHPLLGLRHDLSNDGITFDRELSALDPSWLGDHRVFGRIVAPAALHAALATTAIARVAGTVGVAFEGFQIHAPLVFDDADEAHPDHGRRTLQVALGPSGEDGTRSVEIHSRSEEADSWLRHAEGRVVAGSGDDEGGAALDVEALKTELAPTSLASFYEGLAEVGLGYGPLLRVVESVWSGDGESLVEVALPAGEESGDAAATVVLLDGCFQALAAASEAGSEEPWLPFGWDRLWLAGALPERVLCHVRVVEGESASGVRMAELDLYGMDGECIGGVRGFVLKRATRAALLSAVTGVEDLLYDVVWREGALSGGVRGAEFLASPGVVAGGMRDFAVHLGLEGVEAGAAEEFLVDIERLARGYAREALEGLGWQCEAGAVVRPSELRRPLKVVAEHERLLHRLFGLLEAGGLLERSPEGWVVSAGVETAGVRADTGDVSNPGELLDTLLERYPFGGVELGLLGRCGAALCDVLRGRVEGLELLFGVEGGGAESLYHEAPLARAMNRQVGEVVSGLVEAMPEGRRLRVLEVGAGTGGTTGAVLGALPAGGYEYTYTDISAGFFGGAEGRFGGEGASLVYRVLDIERDPVGQGFEAHGYDVVVAANVLHATRDLGEALGHCRALLAPSGVLVCLEGLRSQGWLDLTFGLLEGWWRYGDGYRTDGALVGEGVWRRALGEAGYGEVSVVSSGSGATQGVIVARGPSEVVEPEGLWLLASDRGETGRRLAAGLVARNQRVVVAGEGIAWPEGKEWSAGEALPGVTVAHVEPARREAWRSLIEGLTGAERLRGVVHLSGLDGGGEEALTSEEPTSETLTSEGLLGEVAHGSGSALALVQGLLDADVAPAGGVWLVTRGAQSLGRERGGVLSGAALWGLGRTVGLEAPGLGARLVDLDPGTEVDIGALVDELLSPDRETQVAHRGGVRHGARLVRGVSVEEPARPGLSEPATVREPATAVVQGASGRFANTGRPVPSFPRRRESTRAEAAGELPYKGRLRGDGTYLVTGGLGGLGREVAGWLAEHGAGAIVLNGRRAPDPEAEAVLEALRARGVRVEVEIADVSDGEAVEAMLGRIGERLPPLSGVIHSVGVLSDAALTNQDWGRFERVLGPKMVGAWHLHRATRALELDLFVLFTSAAGVLGNAGQANHAAANAFLDRLARHRRSLGLAGQAIAWGAWSGTGEAEEQRGRIGERLRATGQGWLAPAQGLRSFDRLMGQGAVTALVTVADWPVLAGRLERVPAFLDELVSPEATSARELVVTPDLVARLRATAASQREALLVEFVREELRAVLRLAERPSATVGFFDLGMDSLMAVELRNRLNRALSGVCTVSGTAVFDHPDAERLARHLAGELEVLDEAPVSAPVRAPAPAPTPSEDDRVAIVGMACRFPGGADLASFWEQLAGGRDAVAAVAKGCARPGEGVREVGADGGVARRWGAYIDGIDRFDASFFRIAPVEARLLDPQQRLMLETSWEALEEAGIDAAGLRGSRAGVFAGICSNDYRDLFSADDGDPATFYMATGSGYSTAIGRVAFTLGLEGPAIAVDTACSSSLVALHQAVVSLQRGEVDLALAGGVNAILSPMTTEVFASAGMLAPDGRCKTFDAAADGYVRGEGCGMVVLKRLSDAEAAGDRIWAVVRGSAVNQDGASAGLTVPSGPAQERVIAEALSRAGLAPSEVDYLEAHGTGTELGDPVEAHAAAAAYGPGRAPEQPLLIGSVKTNVGHLESAAGVAGLIKTVLSMHHGVIPRHLHYETPSPRMDWGRLPLRVTSEATPWPESGRPVRAGVSSFGFSGTNAHVIVESPGAPGEGGAGAGAARPVGTATGAVAGAYSLRGRPVGAAHLVGAWWAEGEGSLEADAPAPAGARLPADHAIASDTTRSGSRARSIQGEDSSVALMAPEARDIEPRVRRVLALSARSDAALRGLATRYLAWLDGQVGQSGQAGEGGRTGQDRQPGEDGQAGPAGGDAEQAARDGQAGGASVLDGATATSPSRVSPNVRLHTLSPTGTPPAGDDAEQTERAGAASGMEALLADMAWTAGVGRSRFEHRAGVVFGGVEELRGGLERLASEGGRGAGSATRVAFLFTGQGSQWAGMGRALYRREPVVRAVLERCEREMVSLRGESLLDVMFGREGAAGSVDDTTWTQPALYALGCALSALWESVGVRPVAVLGHSVGELAAAHVAGVFGLEEGLRLASVRGELMGGLPSDAGAMTAVFASAERVEALIEESGAEGVEVAADNGTHRVVSGLVEGVEALEGWCIKAGVRCGRLVTSHAFHSGLMEPVLDGIEAAAGGIEVSAPVVSLVSNVTGRVVGEGELLDGAYWRRHARAPVAYGPGVGALSGLGVDVVIELGPGSVLGPLLAQVWPTSDVPVVLASQRRVPASGHRDAASAAGPGAVASRGGPGATVSGGEGVAVSGEGEGGFVEAVAGAWEAGLGLRFEGLYAGELRRRLSLPTYPFERRRYWVEGSGRRRKVRGHPLLGERRDLPGGGITFERELSASEPRWLEDHRVVGRVMAPAALHALLATAAWAEAGGNGGVSFDGFQIHAPLVLEEADEGRSEPATVREAAPAVVQGASGRFANAGRPVPSSPRRRESTRAEAAGELPYKGGVRSLQVMVGAPEAEGSRLVEVYSRGAGEEAWIRHAEGRVGAESGEDGSGAVLDVEGLKTELAPVSLVSFYEGLAEAGLGYGSRFRVVESVWSGEDEALAEVALAAGEEAGGATTGVMVLDGCFQALAAAGGAGTEEPWLPFGWDRLWLAGGLPGRVLCHVRRGEGGGGSATDVRRVELDLYGMDGECIGGVRGFVLKRATRAALLSAVTGVEGLLYDVMWRERALSGGLRPAEFWSRRGRWRAVCGILGCILARRGSRPGLRRTSSPTWSGLRGGMRWRRWRGWGGGARRVRWSARRSCVDR